MKLLVTVLGRRPAEYVNVHWRVDGKCYGPLGPPAQALAEHEQVTHALLLIPDSLLEVTSHGESSDLCRQAAEWTEEMGEIFEPFVLPSRYAPKIQGSVLDFYYAALYHIVDWFRQHVPKSERSFTILLEGSTGLNVLQLLLYRTVQDFAQTLAYTREVELKVYTADPVTRQMEDQEVALHLTESRQVIPMLPHFGLLNNANLLQPGKEVGGDPKYREKRDALNRYWHQNDLLTFLAAVYQGIPLGILTWYPKQANEAWKVLTTLYRYALMKASFHEGRVVRQVELSEWWRTYALGFLLAIELRTHFSESLERWQETEFATLQNLDKLVAKLYRYAPVLLNRFQAERSLQNIDIEKLKSLSTPVLLVQVGRSSCEAGSIRKDPAEHGPPGPDKRNFFAHMGFERNAVEAVLTADGEIGFRYSENSRNSIQKYLRESVKTSKQR
ncbi:MAG TPA: hypothetical protein ENK35_02725 [Candidatus Tenderia sp.]|nr:hypothetical protein [Candidatus Tenderia sp.]